MRKWEWGRRNVEWGMIEQAHSEVGPVVVPIKWDYAAARMRKVRARRFEGKKVRRLDRSRKWEYGKQKHRAK